MQGVERLEGVPSAGPTADERTLYVCMDDRISAYLAPNFRLLLGQQAQAKPESAVGASKPEPSPQEQTRAEPVV